MSITIKKVTISNFKLIRMVTLKKINIKMPDSMTNKIFLKLTIDIKEKEITLHNTNKWTSTLIKVMENQKLKK